MDCLFCKIANGDIPSDKIYEDDSVVAFNDIDPKAPVHFLVIPKQHIDSCADIDRTNSGVVAHIFEVISEIAKDKKLDSFRVVSNT
ncbi:MAG: HIT domain-containing protein, partial [Oscillospiraceae bacterium]